MSGHCLHSLLLRDATTAPRLVVMTDAVLRPDEDRTRQQALGHALKQGLMAAVSVYMWSLGCRAALIKDAQQAWLISYQPRKSKGKCWWQAHLVDSIDSGCLFSSAFVRSDEGLRGCMAAHTSCAFCNGQQCTHSVPKRGNQGITKTVAKSPRETQQSQPCEITHSSKSYTACFAWTGVHYQTASHRTRGAPAHLCQHGLGR